MSAWQLSQTVVRTDKPVEATAKIAVIIPTMNEPAIGKVISGVRESLKGFDYDVIVVDRSTDSTAENARKAGARVITQENTGYGNAYLTGFRNVSPRVEIVVMIDGDDTRSPATSLS